jgi:phosphoribosylformylglycinamidine cyclo-ligase
LLEPTHIYVREIVKLLSKINVHGLANITGGGLKNVPRVNPKFRYALDDPMPVPSVFPWLQELGAVQDHEMYKTFNMGMGFLAVVSPEDEEEARRLLRPFRPKVVGRVERGAGCVLESLGLSFESKT